jgi:integrase
MKTIYHPRTFTIDEIRQLYEQAKGKERVFLLLGLNCGYGHYEILSLKRCNLWLRRPHPNAEMLGFESKEEDSFLAQMRQTGVWMEHLLWRETAKLLAEVVENPQAECSSGESETCIIESAAPADWLFKQMPKNCGECGRPIRKTSPDRIVQNSWHWLMRRIRETRPDFPMLPFGALRKTAAGLVRQVGADERTLRFFLGHSVNSCDEMFCRFPPIASAVRASRQVEDLISSVFNVDGCHKDKDS